MTSLSVREMGHDDIPLVIDYWVKHTALADYERMGVNVANIPTPEQSRARFEKSLGLPAEQMKSCATIWLVDGRPVGYSVLGNIRFGESGGMHLHMWDSDMRGRGYGTTLFCLSALFFYERFHLKQIICEPKATNPMPNKALQKVGFPLIRTYVGSSSPLSLTCELNCYAIERKIAEAYVRRAT